MQHREPLVAGDGADAAASPPPPSGSVRRAVAGAADEVQVWPEIGPGPAGRDRFVRGDRKRLGSGDARGRCRGTRRPRSVIGRPLTPISKTSPIGTRGLPGGSRVERTTGIGSPRRCRPAGVTGGASRNAATLVSTGDPASTAWYAVGLDRLEQDREPAARTDGHWARRRSSTPAANASTPATPAGSNAGRSPVARRRLDPVVGTDVAPGHLGLAAFDAHLRAPTRTSRSPPSASGSGAAGTPSSDGARDCAARARARGRGAARSASQAPGPGAGRGGS